MLVSIWQHTHDPATLHAHAESAERDQPPHTKTLVRTCRPVTAVCKASKLAKSPAPYSISRDVSAGSCELGAQFNVNWSLELARRFDLGTWFEPGIARQRQSWSQSASEENSEMKVIVVSLLLGGVESSRDHVESS